MKNLILSALLIITTSAICQVDTTTQNAYECDYSKNEIDDFTGDVKKITKKQLFISHTDSALVKYYKNKRRQYLEIECYTGRINDVTALYVHIVIQTKKAYDYYGILSSDSKVMFKLSNGELIELQVASSEFGDTNYDYGYTSYSTYMIVNASDIESFMNSSVDKIRVYWSKGYEDYDCDNPNLLKELFYCIK
jgi:hypothetical protein